MIFFIYVLPKRLKWRTVLNQKLILDFNIPTYVIRPKMVASGVCRKLIEKLSFNFYHFCRYFYHFLLKYFLLERGAMFVHFVSMYKNIASIQHESA